MTNDAPDRLTLVPEDAAANVFVLGHVYIRCRHDSQDPGSEWLRRTVGATATPQPFYVVGSCTPKTPWEAVMRRHRDTTDIPTLELWDVTPDMVEVMAPAGQPVTVNGESLEPVVPSADDPDADGVPRGLVLYRFEATSLAWDRFPDVLHPASFRQLLSGTEHRVECAGQHVATVYAYAGYDVKLKLKLPPLGRIKDNNKAEIVAGHNRAVFNQADRAARAQRPVYQRGRPGFQSLGEVRAFGESVGSSQNVARQRTRTTTWQRRPPGFLFSADSREARDSTYRQRTRRATGRGADALDLGEGETDDADASSTVSLTVSGVEVGRRYADIADQILRVGALIEGIKNMVTSFRLGWYVDIDYQFGVGDVALAWGWKEATDHRAFLGVGIDVGLTLFSGRFEAGFGIKMGGSNLDPSDPAGDRPFFEAVGFFYFTGDLRVQFALERDSPEIELGLESQIRASIRGGVGVRVRTPLGADATMNGETGIELRQGRLVLNPDSGTRVEGEVWWLGFKVTIQATVAPQNTAGRRGRPQSAEQGAEGRFGVRIPEIDPVKLGDITIPAYKHDKDLSPAEIADLIHDEFEVGTFEFRQWFSFDIEAEGPEGHLDSRDLAERVTRAILRHPEVNRDQATVSLVASRCRTELERFMRGRITLNPRVPRSMFTRLLEFIHSEDDRLPTGGTTLRGILSEVAVGSPLSPSE